MDILINLLIEEERKRKELEAEIQRPQLQLELPVYDPYMHHPEIENEDTDNEEKKRGVIIIDM